LLNTPFGLALGKQKLAFFLFFWEIFCVKFQKKTRNQLVVLFKKIVRNIKNRKKKWKKFYVLLKPQKKFSLEF